VTFVDVVAVDSVVVVFIVVIAVAVPHLIR